MKVLKTLVLLSIVLALFLTGCARDDRPLLVVVAPSATHGFTADSIRHGEAETRRLAELHDWNFRFVSAAESAAQASAIDTLLGENPDVIVLFPVDGNELRNAGQTILDAGVPLVVFNRFIPDLNPTSEIAGDNVTIGREAGRYFNNILASELAAGPVNILEFRGDSAIAPLERGNGFRETMHSNINIMQSFITYWSQQRAMEYMESFLATRSVAEIESVRAIFTHDDEIVFGIVNALRNYTGPANINIQVISGVSGRRDFMGLFTDESINAHPILGNVEFVTFTFSPIMFRDAVTLGAEVILGNPVQREVRVPTEMVDRSNFEQYMQSERFIIWHSL